ncbi:uncharacterized protein FTJAE_4593 [Fusarium tjaetaba]|uniref:Infection structure specific protein n=1 Tax=Fusarium tjaetaba TaxID=1567544 RepID=A0A8H5RSD9_9HYPO|nr:uncharacterized protein FTJAE_4593 [Fusarium tjaetaba]KAF5640046.1 hypothetical protein FTJAE_4593 [Fusarium tjaetaba]
MRSAIILTVGATVVAASHPALERLEKRDAKECASVASSILPDLTAIPTPDSTLASFLAKQTDLMTVTDQCVIPAVTGSMAKEYTSYASKLSSWYIDQKDGISSLLEACSDVPEVSSRIADLKETATICDKVTWAKETGSSSSGDASQSSDAAASSSTADKGNAAGVNSIKAVAVLAVAGLAGVMML